MFQEQDPQKSLNRQKLTPRSSIVLELALVQSAIIDLQSTKSKMSPEALDLEVARILGMMDKVWDIIAKVKLLSATVIRCVLKPALRYVAICPRIRKERICNLRLC